VENAQATYATFYKEMQKSYTVPPLLSHDNYLFKVQFYFLNLQVWFRHVVHIINDDKDTEIGEALIGTRRLY